jgi:hypothetical protein
MAARSFIKWDSSPGIYILRTSAMEAPITIWANSLARLAKLTLFEASRWLTRTELGTRPSLSFSLTTRGMKTRRYIENDNGPKPKTVKVSLARNRAIAEANILTPARFKDFLFVFWRLRITTMAVLTP